MKLCLKASSGKPRPLLFSGQWRQFAVHLGGASSAEGWVNGRLATGERSVAATDKVPFVGRESVEVRTGTIGPHLKVTLTSWPTVGRSTPHRNLGFTLTGGHPTLCLGQFWELETCYFASKFYFRTVFTARLSFSLSVKTRPRSGTKEKVRNAFWTPIWLQ